MAPTPNYLRLASPNRGKYFISSQVRHVAIGNGIAAVALSITHGHALAHMPMHLYTHALCTLGLTRAARSSVGAPHAEGAASSIQIG